MKGVKEPIISNITFEVQRGSIMGLLGPSGAGKSTLFKLLSLIQARDSGQIVLDSVKIDKGKYKDAQNLLDIGIVFQEDVLWANKTVDQNLRLVGKFKGVKKEMLSKRMNYLKKMLYLVEHSKSLVSTISGGNKRKLCCAMALLVPPKILLLDEISIVVDPMALRNLYSYLRSLKDTTTFLITHRIDEAEKICNQIGIIIEGQIRDIGSPDNLKERN
jgi:ABC-2 type transport system ATP-binding protein